MSSFIPYLDPATPATVRLRTMAEELHIEPERFEVLAKFVQLLRLKDEATYEHSVRVAILASHIARFMHLDRKAM
ncbi:MAG: hypothetical protein RLZZ347_146, partial [Candidatus Parcubacteria bacterium]